MNSDYFKFSLHATVSCCNTHLNHQAGLKVQSLNFEISSTLKQSVDDS